MTKKTKTASGKYLRRFAALLLVGIAGGAGAQEAPWPGGYIELRSRQDTPADRGDTCEAALSGADLALANDDQTHWARRLARAIRNGCDAGAVERRLAAASRAEASESRRRDAAVAAAVRRDRPELYTARRDPAGRPLESNEGQGSGWSAVAAGLTELLAARQAQRAATAYSRPASAGSTPDTMHERVYADVFADGRRSAPGTTNPEAGSAQAWADTAAEIAELLGGQASGTASNAPRSPDSAGQPPTSASVAGFSPPAAPHQPQARTPAEARPGPATEAAPASWQEQVEQIEASKPSRDEFGLGDFDGF